MDKKRILLLFCFYYHYHYYYYHYFYYYHYQYRHYYYYYYYFIFSRQFSKGSSFSTFDISTSETTFASCKTQFNRLVCFFFSLEVSRSVSVMRLNFDIANILSISLVSYMSNTNEYLGNSPP